MQPLKLSINRSASFGLVSGVVVLFGVALALVLNNFGLPGVLSLSLLLAPLLWVASRLTR